MTGLNNGRKTSRCISNAFLDWTKTKTKKRKRQRQRLSQLDCSPLHFQSLDAIRERNLVPKGRDIVAGEHLRRCVTSACSIVMQLLLLLLQQLLVVGR